MAVTRPGIVRALVFALVTSLGTGACEDRGARDATMEESPMKPGKLTAQDLLDIVPRYFARIRREDVEDLQAFYRLRDTSPEYKAWQAKRAEAWDRRREWGKLVIALEPELPEYELWNLTVPPMSSYEAQIVRRDDPELTDGVIDTTLIVRVSYLAPVYEMYESSTRVVWKPHMKRRQWADPRRTHEIGPRFQRAAEVFARAIEEQYGYQRVGPEVLDIQLFNVAMWEDGWYTGSLAEALFSVYRL